MKDICPVCNSSKEYVADQIESKDELIMEMGESLARLSGNWVQLHDKANHVKNGAVFEIRIGVITRLMTAYDKYKEYVKKIIRQNYEGN